MRARVYELARATLERFLGESSDLTEAERALQRAEFERVIGEIEARYASGRPIDLAEIDRAVEPPPPPPTEVVVPPAPAILQPPPPRPVPASDGTAKSRPPSEATARAPAEPIREAPPAVGAPASAVATPPVVSGPIAPVEVEPAPSTPFSSASVASPVVDAAPMVPQQADETVAARPEAASVAADGRTGLIAADPEEDDGIFGTEGTGVAEEPVDRREDDTRRRNLRGAVVLIVLLLAVGGAYHADVGTRLGRLMVTDAPPAVVTERAIAGPGSVLDDPVAAGLWSRVIGARMAAPDGPAITAAFLWDESRGTAEVGATGRITWTRSGKDGATWSGKLTFDDGSRSGDIVVEPDEESPGSLGRMMLLRLPTVVDRSADQPSLVRFFPAENRSEAVDAATVRIGVDRALFGYRPVAADTANGIEGRSVLEVVFTGSDDRRIRMFFRLPPAP